MDNAPVYIYDGSLMGFYCCVYESVYSRDMPMGIEAQGSQAPTLFEQRFIVTDAERAKRVRASIPKKISHRALELVETVYYSCLENKELCMLRYLKLGYKTGRAIDDMISHPDVNILLKAEKHLIGEKGLFIGFVRFTDYGGLLAAKIKPKNFLLPFLAEHFSDRYSQERLIIYDETHGAALIYEQGRCSIAHVEDMQFAPPDEGELELRALWKRFYDTIAIKERINPKCRMSHMPKRYWSNIFEMDGEE